MSNSASEDGSRTPWGTLVLGTILGAGVLLLIHFGPFQGSVAQRYVSHPVECVEVIMFGCALAAFGDKWRRARAERRALKASVLPLWDGQPVSVSEAGLLSVEVNKLPARFQQTYLVRRIAAILHYVTSRNSAAGLDEQLRTLSDNDATALEGSYSLTRFITWAIPILGFLGTVLGITGAIAGVTPEVLEQSLSSVTDGLALAFDSTALGLALTMAAMFLNFLVERAEWAALEAVDHYVDRQIAHRFEQATDSNPLQGAMEQVVRRQAEIWAEALVQIDRRRAEMESRSEQKLSAALQRAIERTLEVHAGRMAALEKQAIESGSKAVERIAEHARAVCDSGSAQQQAVAKLVQGVTAQVQALGQLQSGEEQLLRLQETLDRNLGALAAAGTLDQAVHSLTAAIHLLTTRADPNRIRKAA